MTGWVRPVQVAEHAGHAWVEGRAEGRLTSRLGSRPPKQTSSQIPLFFQKSNVSRLLTNGLSFQIHYACALQELHRKAEEVPNLQEGASC